MLEFLVPLLTSLQLPSYLVLCISDRIFIIPRLQNIHCRQSISELFSLRIVHLPNCYSIRSFGFPFFILDESWGEHLSRSLPTEMIYHLLRSIGSERLIRHTHSAEFLFEIISKWLQVSVSECNRRTPRTKNPIFV